MKTVIGVSQFFKQNEPKIASLIGNIGLLLAFITGTIMSLPSLLTEAGFESYVIPAFLLLVVKYCTLGGILIKVLTKLWGTIDAMGKAVSTTLPSALSLVASSGLVIAEKEKEVK